MAKAYWVSTYFSVSNPEAMAEYAKLAGPAMAAGRRQIPRPRHRGESLREGHRPSAASSSNSTASTKAVAAHDGPGYQAALKVLGNAAQRDIRIVEGL